MQSSCMGCLMELAEQDPNILYLTADSGEGGLDLMFRRYFPDRAFEFGIAEENLVGAAAGLAASGKIPFVYTAAPFWHIAPMNSYGTTCASRIFP